MREETEALGGGITFTFPGVQERDAWGVSTFLPLLPFVCRQLSYPLFPFAPCALIFAVKMVCYLLHRGIVSLS